ncbi:hypothetical protein LZK98_01135 [Sphingomonas cannabina]|uniref:hypothetical protein n=1 Tax=Sphingomonas cannabina TaxID=2899123 RepID=UPI001F300862|nr:hypothetical protein [Sphingomonas cannabina]UIJ45598.1 hypothetical protein LZK98_01135 [Sphingomonas cannabina]
MAFRKASLHAAFLLAAAWTMDVSAHGNDGIAPSVGAPPATLRADPFYAKYLDAGGIPVIASAKVPDRALAIARDIIAEMLAHRPDLAAQLAADGFRVAVTASASR